MKSDRDVLVIASDAVLRRSLAFLLEAEGFDVTSSDGVPPVAEAPLVRARCAVVDDASVEEPEFWARLATMAESVVLLLARVRDLPADLPVTTVEKPLLGGTLVEAVTALLAQRQST